MPLPPQAAPFRRSLLRWYDRHRRALPWRIDRDPYRVWVSEIMLQQTRVAAVLDHYARFLDRFGDVHALARAPLTSVLAAWSGLGYYRRARLMHAAARQIVRERDGLFPQTSADWRHLPGIGRYTAAAIASIAFGERCAVVDGNVERVLNRVAGLAPRDCWPAAERLLSPSRPGDFNQAIMELGATVCTPVAPRCDTCPIRRWCDTRLASPAKRNRPTRRSPGLLPAGISAPIPKPDRRFVHQWFALVLDKNKVLLSRRAAHESLMPGMWELPPLDLSRARRARRWRAESTDSHFGPLFTVRHSITTTDYLVTVVDSPPSLHSGARWFALDAAARLPLTGLARKILRRANLINNQY